MEPRISEIRHPNGMSINTPLLIPSFSSKGFYLGANSATGKEESEIFGMMLYCRELLTDTMLVSAYDIHHNYTPQPDDYQCCDLTFVDSGGYETSNFVDFTGDSKYSIPRYDWNVEKLKETISNYPEQYALTIVNLDCFKPITEQIGEANQFFQNFNHLNDLLIKPIQGKQLLEIQDVQPHIYALKGKANIVGFTEKEIGYSILDRMIFISKIRTALDQADVAIPIHIFGSLDPISTILYFLAGAEVFDGLTWLKYGYHDGLAVYKQNYSLLNESFGIHTKNQSLDKAIINRNINYLEKMKFVLTDYATTKDFSVFNDFGGEKFSKMIEKSYQQFINKIK